MRFLDPDAGEMLDRLTVLARKRLEKPEREHFFAEEEALLKHWGERLVNSTLLPQVLRLAALNMAIWQVEDDIRQARRIGWEFYDSEYLVTRMQSLNEERARMVQFFNAKLGSGSKDEKDFAL